MLFLALSLPWPLEPLLYTPCIRFFVYDISFYLSKKKKVTNWVVFGFVTFDPIIIRVVFGLTNIVECQYIDNMTRTRLDISVLSLPLLLHMCKQFVLP